MLTWCIWWSAIILEAVLLYRGFRKNLLDKYPLFYSYIFFIFLQSVVRAAIHRFYPDSYAHVYWITEFPALVIGCGVVFEIYRIALAEYPGTARLARNLLLFVFAMAVAKALVDLSSGASLFGQTNVELERNLRIVQAAAIIVLGVLFFSYAIPFGRNLRGILLGYWLFVVMSVVQLTLSSHFGVRFNRFWFYLQPGAYVLVLFLWTVSLWSYHPIRVPEPQPMLEQDYQRLAAATLARFRQARVLFGRGVGS